MRWKVSLLALALSGPAAFGQLLHDGQLLNADRAASLVRDGPAALDPLRSPLDRIEVEWRPSPELNSALGLEDAIDLRPLLEARSIELSADAIVGASPSLKAAFFRAPWEELRLIKAFLNGGDLDAGGRIFTTSEVWVYEIPVKQMRLNDWRRPLTLTELERDAGSRLIRQGRIATANGGRFELGTRMESGPAGVSNSPRESNSLVLSGSISRSPGKDDFLVWKARMSGRAGESGAFGWSQTQERELKIGEAAIFDIGFRRKPEPRRFVAVVRVGEAWNAPARAQQTAIRRWRALNRIPSGNEDLAGAELAVIRVPRNLLEFVDPAGFSYPAGYDAKRPFARSGVRPAIFGDREVLDLGPFFERGGAAFPPGSEAWLLRNEEALFLRVLPKDLAAIERFFDQLNELDDHSVWAIDVAAWLGDSPDQRPVPDWSATTLSGGEIEVGAGAGERSVWEGLSASLSAAGERLTAAARVSVRAPHPETGVAMTFEFEDADFALVEGVRELSLDDLAGSGQQLPVRIHTRRVRVDGGPIRPDPDPELRRWRTLWETIFE